MHIEWARSLRDQCAHAGIAFFFKQWGQWQIASAENGHHDCSMERSGAVWLHNDGLVNGPSYFRADGRQDADPIAMIKVGKKRAGRLLDGREHNDRPTVTP